MVYKTENYRGFGPFASSGILETRKHDVSKTGYISVLIVGGKTPTQLGPLEGANVNHWTSENVLLLYRLAADRSIHLS
jgi:hypothetical protein